MKKKEAPEENRFFSKKLETMSIEEIKQLQFKKTKETLELAYHQSAFYKDLFDKAKIRPEDFSSSNARQPEASSWAI